MPSLTGHKLALANAPHLRAEDSAVWRMWGPYLALAPVLLTSFIVYGFRAFLVFLLASLSAIGSESLFKPKLKIANALFIAALLTLLLPQSADWRMALLSSLAAVILAREFFGGIGQNLFSPAAAGLAVSLYFFPQQDSASFTPSGLLALVLLCGGGILSVLKKWTRWETVLLFLGGALAASLCFNSREWSVSNPEILLLGAFFLVPDNATSPITRTGRLIFGFASGALAVLWGQRLGMRAALVASLLFMNALVPLLDSALRPKRNR